MRRQETAQAVRPAEPVVVPCLLLVHRKTRCPCVSSEKSVILFFYGGLVRYCFVCPVCVAAAMGCAQRKEWCAQFEECFVMCSVDVAIVYLTTHIVREAWSLQ